MLHTELTTWAFGVACGWLAVMWTLYIAYTHPKFTHFVMSGIVGIAITGLILVAYESVTAFRIPQYNVIQAVTYLIGALMYGAVYGIQRFVGGRGQI